MAGRFRQSRAVVVGVGLDGWVRFQIQSMRAWISHQSQTFVDQVVVHRRASHLRHRGSQHDSDGQLVFHLSLDFHNQVRFQTQKTFQRQLCGRFMVLEEESPHARLFWNVRRIVAVHVA